MDQEVQEARKKLAERFNNATQIGGKGKAWHSDSLARYSEKKEEACYFKVINEDKKLMTAIKKFGKIPLSSSY